MLRLCALVLFGLSAALPASAGSLTIFAAASTKTALDQIKSLWETHTDHRLAISYAGSSALARQIQLGAPADLFLSANPQWMDVLEADDLLVPDTRVDLLGNRLVLIASGQVDPFELSELPSQLGDDRLAMALVTAVPAGIYGKAALSFFDLWTELGPKVAQTDNTRATLALVASGEAPFGIAYATDAKASEQVSVTYNFPAESHPKIVYPIAAIDEGQQALAQEFLTFLATPVAVASFEDQGFEVLLK